VRTDRSRVRRALVVLGSAGLLITGGILARGSAAGSGSGPRAGSAPLPASVAGTSPERAGTAAGVAGLSPADRAAVVAAERGFRKQVRPGIPVAIDIPVRSANHPQGVHARVTANRLNPDGTLFVPSDPEVVSWAKQDVPPGAPHGTTILTSHINYVINGRTVVGALSDLAEYAKTALGKTFTVRTTDGRVLTYRIMAGREYTKEQLAADPGLRKALYDQTKVYGPADQPSGRLLLVSCGGAFDAYSGEYEDNVFLYALPVG
jgi:hypothetical protein